MSEALARLRLLQLASPALPVGAYSYSQGLEAAVESGIVREAAGAGRWVGDVLRLSMQTMEGPVFLRLFDAWHRGDRARALDWNAYFVAGRETAELRAETLQMGYSLRRLLHELDVPRVDALAAIEELAYPTAFAFASVSWRIAPQPALEAYLFAWLESQVLAAVKTLPLGQTAGQRLLLDLATAVPEVADAAAALADDELSNFAPGLALASSRHETQYSRLFRS